MNINKIKNGDKITLAVEGKVDTNTAPKLEEAVMEILEITGFTDILIIK